MLASLFLRNGYGQEVIAISVPEQDGLDRSQMRVLESVATDIVTGSGYLSAYKVWAYAMETSFIIENEHLLKGESRSLVLIDARLALNVRNVESGHIFASFSERYRGSGENRRAALGDALARIDPTGKGFADFLAKSQSAIVTYYDENESQILARAKAYAERRQFDAAIAFLMAIPEKTSYYEDALEKAGEYYRLMMNIECRAILQKAKILSAARLYPEALSHLAGLELWSADCAGEVDEWVARITAQVSREERLRYEREKEERRSEWDHEQFRLKAMMQVAEEYFDRMAAAGYEPEE